MIHRVGERRLGVVFVLQVPLFRDTQMERGSGISFIVVTKAALMTGHTPASAAGFGSAVYGQGGAPSGRVESEDIVPSSANRMDLH